MKKKLLIIIIALLAGLLFSCENKPESENYELENNIILNNSGTKPIFPRSKPVSKSVDILNYDNLPSKGYKLAAVSLQGLVNR